MDELLKEIRNNVRILIDIATVRADVDDENRDLFRDVIRSAGNVYNESHLTMLALARIRRE